jgi:hypothetical protein
MSNPARKLRASLAVQEASVHDSQRLANLPRIIFLTFEDESADSGDQLNVPIDLGRQMSSHVRRSTFMSEPITGLIRPLPTSALATNSSGFQ